MKRFVGVLLVTAVMAVGATPAWAEAPPGDDRVLAVDTQPGYQAQNSCSPSPKPGAVALLDLLIQRWGGSSWGISRGCEVGGRSEHKEGRAFDWHMDAADPGDRARVAEALAWLTADDGEVARRLGVMYIIWDQKVWASYRRGQGWRPMADRGSYTANHHDHLHISLTWDGAMQQTSWWTGVPVTAPLSGPCGLDGVRACLPPTGQALHGLLPGSTPEPIPPESLPEPSDHPLVGGLPRVGHLLQVVPGTWVPDGAELAFQWIRDGIPVPDANAATYAVTPLDLGSVLLVRVIAYAPDGSVALQLSDELPAVAPGTFQTAPTPTILGSPVVGGVLSVSPGAWQPFPARMTFRWLHDGDPIPGATGYSYTPTAAEAGRRISVEVTASAPGYESTTVTSAASAPVRTAVLSAPAPVVKGEYLVDRTLTAVPGTWSPTPTALAYQWFRDGKPVAGATKSSFTLTAADLGTEIQVRLRGSRPGYATKSVMSSAHEVRQAPPAAEPPDTSPTPSLPPSSPPSEPAEPTPDPTPTEPTPDPTPSEAPEPTPAEPAPPEPSEATPAPADEDPPQAEPEPETAPTRAAERTPAPTPAPTPEPPPAEPPEPEPTGAP